MKHIAASLIFAATLTSAVAQTNSSPARTLSLADCINEALKHNFDVQVERYEPQVSLYDLHAAYGGYDPTFSISGVHEHNNSGGFFTNSVPVSDANSFNSGLAGGTPWGMTYNLAGNVAEKYGVNASPPNSPFDVSGGSAGVSLDQPLLKNFWVDGNRVAISVAKNRLKFSEQGLRQQLIATVTAVENAFYELIYAREHLIVRQQALDLAQTQLDQDKQRVQVGSLAPLDVKQDEAQLAQSRASLIAAQFNLAASQNTLKNLITDTYLQWHDVDIEPSETLMAARHLFDLQDSWSQGMTQRPDLLEAKLNVEQQGIQLRYSRNQLFPQLDLVGSYGFNGAAREFNGAFGQMNAGDRPYYSYGAQLSIPLSNTKARNSYKTSKANEQQLLLRLKQLEQNVMVQIDNAVKQAQSAWESVDATKEARTYAEAALDAEQKKYAVGKSTTFTVLQLQNNLTSARSEEIRSLANYNEALANLAQQEGSTLQRHKLDVQLK